MKIEEIPPIENVELEVKIAYGKINQLVDLVNSQQEAIEKLEKQDLQERLNWTDKRMVEYSNLVLMLKSQIDALEPADDKPDTHRTVTLRIPKGMRVGEAMYEVWTEIIGDSYGILEISDTDLQKALDEVKK